jgi:DNA-binding MarR family transcriptional regulator
MPASVAKSNELHVSHVSRALRELEKKNLVECMTPDATKNRIYQITEKGATILKKLDEMD